MNIVKLVRQRHNLSDYNGARWRSWRRQPDPALGRFAQADTLVPQPGNPLAWDRYAYTLNNPVSYIDPSGHKACSNDGDSFDTCTDPLSDPINWMAVEQDLGIKFVGSWTEKRKIWVVGAAVDIGRKIAKVLGGSSSDAFRNAYSIENPLIFLFGTNLPGYTLSGICSGIDSGGCTTHDTYKKTWIINFWDQTNQYGKGIIFIRNVVHELGHTFNSIFESAPANQLSGANLGREKGGYAGPPYVWQFSPEDTPSENFADMFVGWTYEQWGNDDTGYGARRNEFMYLWMTEYLYDYMVP